MPGTWRYWSTEVFGYVEKMTPVNEEYVALRKIQHHIDQGYSDKEIALVWNQGNPSPCKSGINSKGVKYNSCAYVEQFELAMR